jgi:glycosyltransferase involved in cell wall biosynthesis
MKSRRLTVLMIDKYYFIKGGAERYYFELKAVLESHGHRVIPFSMAHPENQPSEFESFFVSNIDFHARSLWQKIRLSFRVFGRILYSIEARRRLERLIRRVRPDVAHLHMIDHQLSPSILHTLRKHRIPIVQTAHQYKLVCPNYLFYIPWRNQICTKCLDGQILHPLIERCHKHSLFASGLLVIETVLHRSLQIFRLVDRFHAPSRFMGEMLRQGGIPDGKIVPHNYCIRIEEFPQSRRFEDFYLYIGRLSPEKGIFTLLEAAVKLPDHPLFLIGDGPERPALEEFVRQKKAGHIQFKGNLDKTEVIRWLSRARFVVAPSEWFENSPLVIYEAFALGKPVIGADIGGITELVEDRKNGLLFTPGDADGLRSRIQMLMTDSAMCRKMGAAARRKAEALFSDEEHYPFIMELYQSVMDEKTGIPTPVETKG